MKLEEFTMCCVFVILLLLIGLHYDLSIGCETYNLFFHNFTEGKIGLNGFYNYDDEYYCVLTKGRGIEAINNTEYHEACHALVHRDYNHFCGKNQTVRIG